MCTSKQQTKPAEQEADNSNPPLAAGYFSGAELAVRPQQIAQAVELFGTVPGLEYATAAAWAQDNERQVGSGVGVAAESLSAGQ